MKTAVIYARYSSDKQTEQSIEGQLRVCQEYAERNKMTIVNTYIDRAMTGTNDNRADFQRMLKDSYKKAWDIVLVYKLDRFSRDKYETAIHRRTLKNNGVKLISAMENIPDTPEGIILESLLEGMNQYFSAELSQKVLRGMKETRSKGHWQGGAVPYGYNANNAILTINEEEANVIRTIFNEFLAGKLVPDIIDSFTEKGILINNKPFPRNTIYYILRNEKYSGVYRFKDEVHTNIYPPIISKELFTRVREKIELNKYGKHKPDVVYLLKNKIKCGICGHIVHSDSGTSSNGNVLRYYKCVGKGKAKKCELKPVKKEVLEKLVIDTILKSLTPELIEKIADKIYQQHKDSIDNKSMLKMYLTQLKEVEDASNNVMKAIEAGIITQLTKGRLQELERQRAQIQERIAIEKANEAKEMNKNDVIKFLSKAIQKEPLQMISILINIIILYNNKIEIYFNYIDTKKSDDFEHQIFCFNSMMETVKLEWRREGYKDRKQIYKVEVFI